MLAEDLVVDVLGTAGAHHSSRQHNDVLLIGTGASQRPLQRVRIYRVAHGNQHAAGPYLELFQPNRILLLELEVLLHLLLRELMFRSVSAL